VSSLAFLSPGPGAIANSPMEPGATAAGATFEDRDGWKVATSFTDLDTERALCAYSAGFADLSHLGKIELQAERNDLAAMVEAATGGASLALGRATRANNAWWCPYSPTRAVVLCAAADTVALRDRLTATVADANGLASVIDITAAQGAVAILGPLAREVFARFTAIDLRPQVTPVHAWRPGSVARTGGAILCEAPDRYVLLFGAAFGHYIWTTIADAAEHLGGGPVGVDTLPPLDAPAAASADGASPEAPHA
jgi:heterotetrameric sarcosine oxidase gamma subunit